MSDPNAPINEKARRIRANRAAAIASRKWHGWRCFYCREAFTEDRPYTFDHYVPRSMWRTNWRPNLVLACEPCNAGKADSLPLTLAWLLLQMAPRLTQNDMEVAV